MSDQKTDAEFLNYLRSALEKPTVVGFGNAAVHRLLNIVESEWNRAIEAVAKWHEQYAKDCDAIAAANEYNDLGPSSQTRAFDHRIDADLIRSEFIRATSAPLSETGGHS